MTRTSPHAQHPRKNYDWVTKPLPSNYVVPFGRFKGMMLQHILEVEPQYILWLKYTGGMQIPTDMLNAAEELLRVDSYEMFTHEM